MASPRHRFCGDRDTLVDKRTFVAPLANIIFHILEQVVNLVLSVVHGQIAAGFLGLNR